MMHFGKPENLSYALTEFDVLTKYFVTFLILVIERSALPIKKWQVNQISTISYDLTEIDVLTKYFVTFLILVIERSALPIKKWQVNQISTISYDLTEIDVLTKYSVRKKLFYRVSHSKVDKVN
jgi:hypothetical protein